MIKSILLAYAAFCCGTASAVVSVTLNEQQFNYSENPRLTEVIAPIALQQNWYWPASALYQLDNGSAVQRRLQIIELISDIKRDLQDKSALQSLTSLERQLADWQLAKRIPLLIDYDYARIKPAINPRFDSGSYLLQLKLRPSKVYVSGAVDTSAAVSHRGVMAVKDYLEQVRLSVLADNARVALIQPDASVTYAGTEAWNADMTEAQPGAQLIVLFKQPIWDARFARLNQLIVEVAVDRILP